MSNKPIVAPPEQVGPDYSIYAYGDNGIFKIIRFKSTAPRVCVPSDKKRKGNTEKMESSLSRTRRTLLELGLCNPWDWFCTFTISKDKHDRVDLQGWYKRFSQWLRDQRKKGLEVAYVLVPERHKDGSWHAHGFMKGNMELVRFSDLRRAGVKIPDKLVNGDFWNWPAYQEKFGFCSFGRLRSPVGAAFYVTKYITKDQGRNVDTVNAKQLYCSQGLRRAQKHGDIYGYCGYLDQFLENHYDFCDTGMTRVEDGLDWSFAMEYMLVESLSLDDPWEDDLPPEVLEIDTYMEAVQIVLDGFST